MEFPLLAVILAFAAAALLAFSMVGQRYALSYPTTKIEFFGGKLKLHKNIVWFLFLFGYAIANGLYATSLNFGPLSLLSCIYTSLLVFNLVFSKVMCHEHVGEDQAVGSLIILGGVVMCVIGAPPSAHESFDPQFMYNRVFSSSGGTYLITLTLVLITICVSCIIYEMKLDPTGPISQARKTAKSRNSGVFEAIAGQEIFDAGQKPLLANKDPAKKLVQSNTAEVAPAMQWIPVGNVTQDQTNTGQVDIVRICICVRCGSGGACTCACATTQLPMSSLPAPATPTPNTGALPPPIASRGPASASKKGASKAKGIEGEKAASDVPAIAEDTDPEGQSTDLQDNNQRTVKVEFAAEDGKSHFVRHQLRLVDRIFMLMYPIALGVEEGIAHLLMKGFLAMISTCTTGPSWIFWLTTIVWAVLSIASVLGLKIVHSRCDCSSSLPVLYGTINSISVCSGLIFYNEAAFAADWQISLNVTGLAVIITGIAIGLTPLTSIVVRHGGSGVLVAANATMHFAVKVGGINNSKNPKQKHQIILLDTE